MKRVLSYFVLLLVAGLGVAAEKADSKRATNTVVLTETGVKNLHLETVEAEEAASRRSSLPWDASK